MFAVFGMTPEYAKRKALQNVKTMKNGKALTQEEYDHDFQVYVTQMLEGGRVVKVSPDFSTPDIAAQWMELAKKYDGRRMEVCIYHPEKEVMRKGIRIIKHKWSFFQKGRDYQYKNSRPQG